MALTENVSSVPTIENLSLVECQVSRRIQETLDGISDVFASPTLLIDSSCEYDGCNFSKKYVDLATLILITWYSDYFQGFEGYVRYEIEDYLSRNLLFPELNASLFSKEIVLTVILSYSKFHNFNEIFGAVLAPKQIQKVLSQVSLKMVHRRKPRRVIRRRGYKDKGSARPSHQWIPKEDWSLTEEQLQLEERRELYRQTVTSIVRTIGGRLLSDGQFSRKE